MTTVLFDRRMGKSEPPTVPVEVEKLRFL